MKKPLKIILWILCTLIVILILLAALAPTWISSKSGQKTLLKWINQEIDGSLEIERVHLSWFGKQHINHLILKDKKGETSLEFEVFETDTSLFYLLFGGRSLSQTIIKKPYLLIEQTHIEKEPKPSSKHSAQKSKIDFKFPNFKSGLTVTDGTLIFRSDKITPITISNIQVEKKPKEDHFQLQADTNQGETFGKIDLTATLVDKPQITAQITNFPIAILDELDQSSLFTEAIGPTLDAQIEIEKQGPNAIGIQGTFKSAHLSGHIEGISENKKLTLNPTTQLELTLTPNLFKQLIAEDQRAHWDLASKTTLSLQVEKAIFPFPIKKSNFKEISLLAKGKIERAELNHKDLGAYSLNNFSFSIIALDNIELAYQGEIKGKETTHLSGKVSINPKYEVLYEYNYEGFPVSLLSLFSSALETNTRYLFGNRFNIKGTGTYISKNVDAQFAITSTDTEINGTLSGKLPELDFSLCGVRNIYGKQTQVLGETIDLTAKGSIYLQNNFLSLPKLKARAYNPYFEMDIYGQVGEKGKKLSADQIQLIASGKINYLPFEETSLKNSSLYIQVDGSKNLITGKLDSKSADATIEIQDFIQNGEMAFSQSHVNFTSDLKKFPTRVIDSFFPEWIDLVALIGPKTTMQAEGSYEPQADPRFTLNLKAQSQGLTANLAIAVDGTLVVRQDMPSFITWTLTPERYDALIRMFRVDSDPTFILSRPTQVDLQINQFICPTTSPKNLSRFFCHSGFSGDLTIGNSIFKSKETGESIIIQNTHGKIEGENFSQAIDLSISGDIQATNVPESENSAFSFEGKMLNFWTDEGKINREQLTVDGELSLELVPVRPLTGIIPMDEETRAVVQAILGELVNARVYGTISQLAGPLTIDLKSSNFQAKLPLTLTPDAIYLREPINTEITLTEAVNTTLLTDIAPLFLTGAYSETPIRVYIDPQGFVLPIRPYSLGAVQIGKAVIDLGKISVRNGGDLQQLMDFLEATEISPDGWMEAWFTPIYLSLQNGVASYNRFDALLAKTMHIAMWGQINLINNQVHMTLGIAPSTLEKRFKIKGLSKNELFQVKMRGTTDNLDLDWSAATTRIGFLVAKTAGGQIGSIVGGILEQVVKTLGEEPSPPPTTTPFPWNQ
ncbi:MAG: hypothetical protein S4CHLAM123_14480 [Chlamydiales bacterium]|nr:hypothetical protein [Chlamydiales bacterium]